MYHLDSITFSSWEYFRAMFLCYATTLHFPFCFPMSFLHVHVFIVIRFRMNVQLNKMFLILLT